MNATPRTEKEEMEYRAEWLNRHGAPKEWVILTVGEIEFLKQDLYLLRQIVKQQEDELKMATSRAALTPDMSASLH